MSAAAEGLEVAVATDYNFVTDLMPTIAKAGVQDFVTAVTGVELSTLEMGHFNSFPTKLDVMSPTHFPFVQDTATAPSVVASMARRSIGCSARRNSCSTTCALSVPTVATRRSFK